MPIHEPLDTTSGDATEPKGDLRLKRPVHGPYASSAYDAAEGKWRVRLTDEGQAFCAAYLEKWPAPGAVLAHSCPGLYLTCRLTGIPSEDIDAACLSAVAIATVRFEPARNCKFVTALVWSLRGEVSDLLNRHTTVRSHETVNAHAEKTLRIRTAPAPADPDARFDVPQILKTLSAKRRTALTLYFGIDGHQEGPLEDVGRRMSVSKEMARQLVEMGLRDVYRAVSGDDPALPVYARIKDAPFPVSPEALADQTGFHPATIKSVLRRLLLKKRIQAVRYLGRMSYGMPRLRPRKSKLPKKE
jgi:hypothetical protein